MTKDNWMTVLRVSGFFVSLILWFLSIKFSSDGFNIEIKDLYWVGILLGLCATAFQLIWNKLGKSAGLTLYLVGFLVYAYSIFTNISGILEMQGKHFGLHSGMVFPVILGCVLDIVPEPLFVLSLVGFTFGNDFMSNILGVFGYTHTQDETPQFGNSKRPQQQQSNKQQQRPQSKPGMGREQLEQMYRQQKAQQTGGDDD